MYRVAVIGAGPAGLCALRHLASHPTKFSPQAFEQSEQIGGTWVYSERTGTDEEGFPLHTSMYKNLRTNLPKETMAYQGFPFDSSLPSYPQHQDVLKYLNKFTDHYGLQKHIQFRTSVLRVHPIHKDSGLVWEVTTKKRSDPENCTTTEEFDAVMVCNGLASVPLIPVIPGMETFTGEVVHSHSYRRPEDFTDKTVLCLGAGSSGGCIALDLSPHVPQVYLSHREPPVTSPLPSNMIQKAGIKRISGDIVVLENDEEVEVDVILLCTGYKYSFPFLTPECGISVEDGRVYPIYKHILQPSLPSLSFIGICKKNCPFPQFDLQVQFALAALDGSMPLPSSEEMQADIDADYESQRAQGKPHRHSHNQGPLQWAYNDMIADLVGVERLHPVIKKVWYRSEELREADFTKFRDYNFRVEDEDNFTVLLNDVH